VAPIRQDIQVVNVNAGRVAEELGDMRTANMVMLGAFVRTTGLVTLDNVVSSLGEIFEGKKKVIDMNADALKKGYEIL
jgi:2-oxoglutarate ferredoxin oxidoreductase subunit gamma